MTGIKAIILVSLTVTINFCSYSQDDSTLYVRTIYQHEIFKGRNSARKNAIKQEMRDSEGKLFREVFYSVVTKQVDSVLYYFYNKDGTIRLIEKVDGNENLIEYYKYNYKKNELQTIEHFNAINNTSKLLSKQYYNTKKNISSMKEIDDSNNLIKSIEKVYKNNKILKQTILDYRLDSAYKKITYYEYQNDLILKESEIIISKNEDSTRYYKHYSYNSENLADTINTYNSNNEFLTQTLLNYTKNGSLINKRTIGKNNYYIENITYELRKYYRDLPRKEPQY